MKTTVKLLSLLLALVLVLPVLCACSDIALSVMGDPAPRSIQSIAKTASDGNTDTYTITFSDGTTTTFTIKNGDSGDDALNQFAPLCRVHHFPDIVNVFQYRLKLGS